MDPSTDLVYLKKILMSSHAHYENPHTEAMTAGTTKTILTKMWAKFPEVPDLENEFIIFHTQLLHNWHYISVFNFFPLDYSYLYKGLCVMMAYFILMIQLEMVTLNSN
ncbi:uncharacterized protein LOC112694831 [Athalia rosae]|uniref:uncharacterized protein LOC112694831 n=1 Tax=Athalia rosae TaxID=37344 RepID=UPI000DE7FCDD|nr:uncharacterized protein LOC112694831 [Athalia rosae]